jgi:hypothetical protein
MLGSVRGAAGDRRPYRDTHLKTESSVRDHKYRDAPKDGYCDENKIQSLLLINPISWQEASAYLS